MNVLKAFKSVVLPIPVPSVLNMSFESLGNRRVQAAAVDQVFDCEVAAVEFADFKSDDVHAARRNDGCDAATGNFA